MAPIDTTNAFSERLREIGDRQREVARLLAAPDEDQRERGYYHTLREILQQPLTWIHTGDQMAGVASRLQASLAGVRNLFLTGSGSSEYAGHCVRLALQKRLGANTLAIGGGALLTHSRQQLPPERPALMVSIARSGDSPESVGAVSLLLESEPEVRHLVLTCNARGKLATNFAGDARVQVVTLHDETNDRSLVMTSSFTNLVIAAYFLGLPQDPALYQSQCRQLSAVADHLFDVHFGTLARIGSSDFKRAVFLGSGSRLGATLEASLKMLEMTAGQVSTLPETYLGLRHGPMSYVDADTLVVCFLSSDATVRAYECDLIRELNEKRLGKLKVIVGDGVPSGVARDQDVIVDCPGLAAVGDDCAPVVEVVVAQILALFRCLQLGLRPDSPSESGVISRVVQSFKLHLPDGSGEES